METLIIDAGETIVGIFSNKDKLYNAYQGDDILTAIRRIELADEIVTYNGKNYDLGQLGKFAGLQGDLPLKGTHTDMRSIIWSDRIWGSNLESTYLKHFASVPDFPETYVGSNERDVHMTFKLWELWKVGKLKTLDGSPVVNKID
jgi:hypothetical protein